MKINDELLHLLGMTDMQARTYLAALELGEGTMQALARKSGLNRTTIYTFIDELKERGYILETRRAKRRVYSAVHPERLVEMQRTRLGGLEHILPELLAINNQATNKPKVTFYEGLKGIEDVYADMLREKKEVVSYEDMDNLKTGLPERFFNSFPKERARRDILIRSISRDTPFAREFSTKNRGLLRETKFIPAGELRTDISIYGDKVALMDLRGSPPSCVLIENKNLADTLRTVWKQLWDRLGPVVG
ncbi:hypothetical protein FJY93_01885 [Candidatus Kaiserbacteria bacterium]|nr:hypothetical protein [Candidatus Kaiserbacteria bacterium]